MTRGLKGAHLPNGLCWVLSVVCRPIFSINSHFIAHYKCGGWGDRELAFQCVLDTTLCDKDCPWLVASRCFFLGTVVSSTSKTDHHDITDILLNMVITTVTVVYGYSSSRIWGGAVRRRYRKSVTERDPDRKWPEVCSAHARIFPALFSYYSSSTKYNTVVQVPWLPEVTEGHVSPWVCTCATGSCTISALMGPFDRK